MVGCSITTLNVLLARYTSFMRTRRGMSLIDVVVGVALMLITFSALFALLQVSLALSTLAKTKAVAIELASTQMEYLRSLPYSALGTVGGAPSGALEQTATSTINGVTYVLHTRIVYSDDPADGIGVNDSNSIITDYKKAEIVVAFSANRTQNSVTLVSNFVPQGIETP